LSPSEAENAQAQGYNITKSFYFLCQKEDAPAKKGKGTRESGSNTRRSMGPRRRGEESQGCGNTFIKLMIVELSHTEAEQLSKYRVQPLFTSSQNSSIYCPYCGPNKRVGLILKENLIIGGTTQLDYKEIYNQKDARDQAQ
jgi:hypothetical protein